MEVGPQAPLQCLQALHLNACGHGGINLEVKGMGEHGRQEAPVAQGFHVLGGDEDADQEDGHDPFVGGTDGPQACPCPGGWLR